MNIEITKLSHDGRGVGRDAAGKTVFIDGVLPGERVAYTIIRSKRRYAEAQVTEILQAAAERVTPQCAHFLTCGGCSQQHISHEVQLAAKQQSLLEQLAHFGSVQPANILPPLTGPLWGYRHKARLGVRYVIKKEKVLVGFREKHSNYLAEIDSCEILQPKIAALLMPLREMIATLEAYQQIAQIEVAMGDERLALVFRNLTPLSAGDQDKLIAFAQHHDFDLYLQPDKITSVYKLYPADHNERLYYQLPAYNLKFAFHPMDFTQINLALNRKMVAQALQLLQLNKQDQVLDLFCGLGNFTLPMATLAGSVTGVEGAQAMVERGYENARANNLSNVNFFAADLTTDQQTAAWSKQSYTKVLLDPPRSGAAEVLALLASLKVAMILYVSCNPATLARDSGILTQQYGYKLAQIGIMDMFPHTLHVETMALFVK
jgi:23S rRNA (uracil1939-C5)-methyltransferase